MAEPHNVIAVPASTSNLGPGFDALSVALDLHLRLRVLDVRPDVSGDVQYAFEGPSPQGENRIETAYRLACRRFGATGCGRDATLRKPAGARRCARAPAGRWVRRR